MSVEATPEMGTDATGEAFNELFNSVDGGLDGVIQEPEEKPETEEPDQLEESNEGDEVEKVETEDEDDSESVEQEAEDEEQELQKFESVNELAEATGLELQDFLDQIKGTVIVNGESIEVTLSEAFKGHQREIDYTRKTEGHAQAVRDWEADKAKQQETIEQQLYSAGTILEAQKQAIEQEYNQLDWNRLRDENPAEWSAKQQEFQGRYNAVQSQITQAADSYQQLVQQREGAQQEVYGKYLEAQETLLTQLIPETADASKRQSFQNDLTAYVEKQIDMSGLDDFAQESLKQALSSAAVVNMINKARLYDQTEKKVEAVKKKVANVPKVIKAGAKTDKQTTAQNQIKSKVSKGLKSGKREHIGDALNSLNL